MNALSQSPYMWIVSIRADDILYEACVTRERDENGHQTGPWGVEGVYVYEPGNLTLEEQDVYKRQPIEISSLCFNF